MLTKTKIGIIIGIIFVILAGLIGTGLLVLQTSEISYSSGSFAFNVTDDRKLVGFADNVFIGKVTAQTGDKINTVPPEAGNVSGSSPQTQFSVEVLENIKGKLSGIITVSQEGGYKEKDGIRRLVLWEGDKLLEPGSTYLFATRFNDIDGWHAIIAPNYGNLPVTDQTDHQNKINRFKKAFSQEIPYKAPVEQKQP